jgi:transposase-like protein
MRAVKTAGAVEAKGKEGTGGSSSSGSMSPAAVRSGGLSAVASDPEVLEKPERRRFTAGYKLRILKLADACVKSGDLGALLRREGLDSSNLNTWRLQREKGTLAGLTPKKRGRKEVARNPLQTENEKLSRENERLANRLKRAELIIDVQKKISMILGIPISEEEEGKN